MKTHSTDGCYIISCISGMETLKNVDENGHANVHFKGYLYCIVFQLKIHKILDVATTSRGFWDRVNNLRLSREIRES